MRSIRIALATILAMALIATAAIVGAGLAILGQRPPAIEGIFTEGPSLTAGHIVNAIAMPDGGVLVAVLADETTVPGMFSWRPHIQVLDPRTEAFGATATPPQGLPLDSMALLHDGRVLILGAGSPGAVVPATVYDPVNDRYDDVGDPLGSRTWPFVITLKDGRVLVGGGSFNTALATVELFDPTTGTFSSAGSMTQSRGVDASATLLEDGRVLVLGAGSESGASAELYDPATGTFTTTGPMTVGRSGAQSATRLSDGRVLVVGGLEADPFNPTNSRGPTATAEIYDPVAGRFTAVGSMAAPRFMHAASILGDGTVLVAGGAHEVPRGEGGPEMVADAEIFDPASGTFRAAGDLLRARLQPAIVAVDDRVLVLGSDLSTGDDRTAASTEWFD